AIGLRDETEAAPGIIARLQRHPRSGSVRRRAEAALGPQHSLAGRHDVARSGGDVAAALCADLQRMPAGLRPSWPVTRGPISLAHLGNRVCEQLAEILGRYGRPRRSTRNLRGQIERRWRSLHSRASRRHHLLVEQLDGVNDDAGPPRELDESAPWYPA